MRRFSMQSSAIAVLVAGLAFSAPALSADLIIEEPAVMPGVVDVGGNWEGVYVGVFAGFGSATFDDENGYGLFEDDSLDASGWLVGVAAGANFYLADGIVAGVVGDIAWSDISGSFYDDGLEYGADVSVNWQGSLRGKLGLDAGAFMPYLTAGLAFANADLTEYSLGTFSDSNTHIGWTVGAGVEIAATEDLSIDVLYRYSDYGAKEYEVYGTADTGLSGHSLTAGLNWKF
jgi:outer membrane immunogenic protein